MTTLPELLQQFTTRYRKALLVKAAVLALLGVAVAGLLAFRLVAVDAAVIWRIGVPVLLVAATAGAITWWLKRRWISSHGAAALLDRSLGLQQRLVTAEEFAHAEQPPALYPLLLEDAAKRYATDGAKFPRPVDHTAGVLAVVLLLLLMWPRMNAILPPAMRIPEPPKREEPRTPPEQSPQDQQQEQQQQQQAGGGSQAQQPQQSQGGNQSDQSQSPRSGGAQQPQSAGQQGGTSGDSGQQQGADQAGQQQPSQGQGQGKQGQAPQQQSSGGAQQGSAQQQGQSGQQGQQQSKASGQQSGQSGAQAAQQAAAQQGANAQGQQGQSGPGQRQAGDGGDQRTGQRGAGQQLSPEGEALKGEIQQLLKEMSNDLKDLQSQINADDQPKPQAGTGTDPNLYGDAESLESGGNNSMAVQVKADRAQTANTRQAGGVGRPAGEVGTTAPKAQAEDASLSDQPIEEAPTTRSAVPVEYRSVFEQLRRPTNTGEMTQ